MEPLFKNQLTSHAREQKSAQTSETQLQRIWRMCEVTGTLGSHHIPKATVALTPGCWLAARGPFALGLMQGCTGAQILWKRWLKISFQ